MDWIPLSTPFLPTKSVWVLDCLSLGIGKNLSIAFKHILYIFLLISPSLVTSLCHECSSFPFSLNGHLSEA